MVERRFTVPGLSLAAKDWGPAGGTPILALHGWLDNAGSFDRLAPRLEGCRVVALDLAGHGASDFRSPDASYELWHDVGDVLDVADQLGWREFTLLGHSRGAAVATLAAAAFPERVNRLMLLEGGVPLTSAAADAPDNLARGLTERRALAAKMGRVFPDREAAIAERAQGFTKVSVEAAAILAERGLRKAPGGFRWHVDQRLKARSELRLTPDQAAAFVARVRAPVLLVMAERSPFADSAGFQRLVAQFRDCESVRLGGGHHFHLEGAEQEIARLVLRFCGL